MCTVSWVRNTDGYVLLFNRDERQTRSKGLSPTVEQRNSVSFIAPVDGDYGGTWIGTNQFGLTLSLLNRFDERRTASPEVYTSRGLLLKNLLDCSDGKGVVRRFSEAKLKQFRPLTLVALSASEGAMLIEWNGRECTIKPDAEMRMPLTSSSVKAGNVVWRRKLLFEKMALEQGGVDLEVLSQFHRSHLPEPGSYSVCMHREDAATVSLSVVTVNRDTIEFSYQPNSPCLGGAVEKVLIERREIHSHVATL